MEAISFVIGITQIQVMTVEVEDAADSLIATSAMIVYARPVRTLMKQTHSVTAHARYV